MAFLEKGQWISWKSIESLQPQRVYLAAHAGISKHYVSSSLYQFIITLHARMAVYIDNEHCMKARTPLLASCQNHLKIDLVTDHPYVQLLILPFTNGLSYVCVVFSNMK